MSATGMSTGVGISSPITTTTRDLSMRRRQFTMLRDNRRASVSSFRSVFIVARKILCIDRLALKTASAGEC